MNRSIALVLVATIAIACNKEQSAPAAPPSGAAPQQMQEVVKQASGDVPFARKKYGPTQLLPAPPNPEKKAAAETPPAGVFDLVKYPSPAGNLSAYVTPDPKDGKKHPAVIWAHDGFGGIGSSLWAPPAKDREQGINAFREAGLIVMAPSWRGEHDNPGRFELFFGEVDDFLSAIDYAAKLPYVDPQRIYIAGSGTGGTLVLLVAGVGTDKFRAAFSFDGAPDVERVVANGKGYGNTPFDFTNIKEGKLRSAIFFTKYIKQPTFYFGGEHSPYLIDAARMRREAMVVKTPFDAYAIRDVAGLNMVYPLTKMVAKKILADNGPTTNVSIKGEDIDDVMTAIAGPVAPTPKPAIAAPDAGSAAP